MVQLTMEMDPQGRIVGSSPENACKLKGLATAGFMATVSNLDVTSLDVLTPDSIAVCPGR